MDDSIVRFSQAERVLIELCRIEIQLDLMRPSRHVVLIELCRIEIGGEHQGRQGRAGVLIELCRIEISSVKNDAMGRMCFNRTL